MTRVSPTQHLLACMLAALFLAACPGDTGWTPPATNDAAPAPSNPPPDDPPATKECSPSTCTYGCCYQGECVTGNSDFACGKGGYQCQQCGGDNICQSGACAAKEKVETCDASNCNGCCDGNTCRPGLSNAQCGKSGQSCSDCSQANGICSAATQQCATDCKPNCAGKCTGAADGCGGTCQQNDCKGCCTASGQCAPGNANDACGKPGAQCASCTQFNATCKSGICLGCTPNCAGKCKGAPDGCGGTCAQSQCKGCCEKGQCQAGNTQTACGVTGGQCSNCSTKQMACSAGKCETKGGTNPGGGDNFPPADSPSCTPDCDEKCMGEADGCGGICWNNTCSGCCSSYGECLSGLSDIACGNYGSSCDVCPLDHQGYDWTCSLYTQTCVKDQATSSTPAPNNPPSTNTNPCSGKADKTSCLNSNGSKFGTCYNGSCCTGCYDSLSGSCESGQSDDYDCGWGGNECEVCASGKTCKSGSCEANSSTKPPATNTNPCSGKADKTVCYDGSKVGECYSGSCCTGCYNSDYGTCENGQSDDYDCGWGGNECKTCASNETCQSGFCNATSSQPPSSGGSTNECKGKADKTLCTSFNGYAGACWGGTCCDGCYDSVSGTCRAGDNKVGCGIGGEKCDVCESTELCSGSKCVTDSGGYDWTSGADDKYTLRLETLTVDVGPPLWDYWTASTSGPDLVFAIKLGQSNCSVGAPYSTCTGESPDVTGTWKYMGDLVTKTAKELKKTHCIYIFDADDDYTSPCKGGSHDLVGSCNITITQQNLNDGKLVLSSCTKGSTNYVKQVDFTLRAE
jgi:hypothetical protein